MTVTNINSRLSRFLFVALTNAIFVAPLVADEIQITEYGIEVGTEHESRLPALGSDAMSDILIYIGWETDFASAECANSAVHYQRLDSSGAATGPPIRLGNCARGHWYPDISNGRIVYITEQLDNALLTDVVLHDITDGSYRLLTSSLTEGVQEPRIHQDLVVWAQRSIDGGNEIVYVDLTWPEGTSPVRLDGPFTGGSGALDIGIGDQLIVWKDNQANIWAAHRNSYDVFPVEVDPNLLSQSPVTDGLWVIWEQFDVSTGSESIAGFNYETFEHRVFVNDSSNLRYLSLDGDYLVYRSERLGNGALFMQRLSDGSEFQITAPIWASEPSILGNKIAYVVPPPSPGPGDLYVTAFEFTTPTANIVLSETELNFGDVALGDSAGQIVTVSNTGNAPLDITSITSTTSMFTPIPGVPTTVLAGGILDILVTFSPVVDGAFIESLLIQSNDPDTPSASITLIGNGVLVDAPPGEQIQAILTFMLDGQTGGTLQGNGAGQSGANRFDALMNMIEAASDMIAAGDAVGACDQLADALKKTDGDPQPPDFVTGPGAPVLGQHIVDLRTTLGCSP